MKFVYPWVFILLVLVPLIGLYSLFKGRQAAGLLRQLVAERLRLKLVGEVVSRNLRLGLFLGGLACVLFALARPQWGEISDKRNGIGRDVIIAVDVSRSMLASDLPPSRLKRAKLAASDLVHQFRNKSAMDDLDKDDTVTRIGIVAFAGKAFLQAPVTSDYSAVLAAIQELDPELIPLPGTNISDALRVAVEAFDQSEGSQKALILISDGEDLEADAVGVAKELAGQIRIFTMGVGTPEGTVLAVPSPRGGMEYIRDQAGNVVQSRLDEDRLTELAQAGGGFYTRLQSGPAEMRRIVKDGILLMEKHERQEQGKSRAIERYQWPLGVALLLIGVGMMLGEKTKRNAPVIAVLLLALLPMEGFAATGSELYEAGDFAAAREAYEAELAKGGAAHERAYNLGSAAYKNGNWSEAIEWLGAAIASKDPQLRSKAEYNFANALVQQARQGKRGIDSKAMEQAVEHYEEALRLNPKLEDASYNRDVVKKILAQKEQQKQKGDKKEKGDQKDEKEESKDQEKGGDPSEKDQNKDGKQDDKPKDGDDKQDGKEGKDDKSKDEKGKQSKGDEKSDSANPDGKNDKGDSGKENGPEQESKEKPKGELKDNPASGQEAKDGKEKQGEQTQAQVQAGEVKLTKEQAAALVESLRSEDRRVQLWTPNSQQQKDARNRDGRSW